MVADALEEPEEEDGDGLFFETGSIELETSAEPKSEEPMA